MKIVLRTSIAKTIVMEKEDIHVLGDLISSISIGEPLMSIKAFEVLNKCSIHPLHYGLNPLAGRRSIKNIQSKVSKALAKLTLTILPIMPTFQD